LSIKIVKQALLCGVIGIGGPEYIQIITGSTQHCRIDAALPDRRSIARSVYHQGTEQNSIDTIDLSFCHMNLVLPYDIGSSRNADEHIYNCIVQQPVDLQ
jgi:hypothetical protein